MAKIEEMERLLREAQAEKLRLLEHRVICLTKTHCVIWMCVCFTNIMDVQEREMEMRRQALEEERRRREDLEKRLQEETSRRQKLVEREVKLREKQRSQVLKLTRRGWNLLPAYVNTLSSKQREMFTSLHLIFFSPAC